MLLTLGVIFSFMLCLFVSAFFIRSLLHDKANARINGRVWRENFQNVVRPEIDSPSVMFVDNLKCHVFTKAHEIVSDMLNSLL